MRGHHHYCYHHHSYCICSQSSTSVSRLDMSNPGMTISGGRIYGGSSFHQFSEINSASSLSLEFLGNMRMACCFILILHAMS
mmetsp:Transcript_19264/g.41408  ORF Transcript_19264/g.41408 Transcript_19264/m.41408 type:complete len:82 (+) Transcript_19264:71-316(+)